MTDYPDVRSYYAEKWGEPVREAIFQKDHFSIGVLKWEVSGLTGGVNFYATVGASNYALPGHEQKHRREFFVGLVPEFDEIAGALARLSIYAQTTGRPIDVGHIYRAMQGLAEDSRFAGFMILDPLEGSPEPIKLADGRFVELLMAVPLHEGELDYAALNGVDLLLREMEKSAAPLWDPRRSPVSLLSGDLSAQVRSGEAEDR